jgi:glycosyltransferase involved in cell wall biosynthesis
VRIAVDARPLCHPYTGIGRYTAELLSRLVSMGHEWYLYSDRKYPVPIWDQGNINYRWGNNSLPSFGSLFSQVMFPVWSRKDDIDLFWSPRHHLPVLLGGKIGTIVSIHDLVWMRSGDTMTRFGRLLEKTLMPRSVRKADRVVAVSQYTKNDLINYLGVPADKIAYIPNASFLPVMENGPHKICMDKKNAYFLFVGTEEPRKNIAGLLAAYKQYVDDNLDFFRLKVVAGKGWGEVSISKLIEEFDLSGHVDRYEFIDEQTLKLIYQNAYALLIPSFYEGFGLPAVEALSQGVPVITSRDSAMEEVAGKAAILVDPYNIGEMAEAMKEISTDKSLYESLCRNAMDRSLVYSWDASSKQLFDVFQATKII